MKNTNSISSGKYNAADTISGIKSRVKAELYTKQISLLEVVTFLFGAFRDWCFQYATMKKIFVVQKHKFRDS